MFSIACTSSATCIEVGAGGRERRTTDGGTTWTDVATAPGNNKPLTQVTCPSELDLLRGRRPRQRDEVDRRRPDLVVAARAPTATRSTGSPARRTSVCYATDIYAHVDQDDGRRRDLDVADDADHDAVGTAVAETGGPNPFAGLMAISCSDATPASRSASTSSVDAARRSRARDPPIVTTTDGGTTWTRQVEQQRARATTCTAISCLPGTTTCTAVGRGGTIVTTTDLVDLDGRDVGHDEHAEQRLLPRARRSASRSARTAPSTSSTARRGRRPPATAAPGMLATSPATGNLVCYATGKQGVTLAHDDRRHDLDDAGRRRHDAADERHLLPERPSTCYAAGTAGTILKTSNGGQTWLAADERHDERPERHLLLLGERRASRSARRERRGHRPLHAPTARPGTPARRRHAGAERRRRARRPRRASRSARPARPSSTADGGATWDAEDERHDGRAERGRLPVGRRLLRGRRRRHDPEVAERRHAWSPQTSGTTRR